MLFLRGIRLDTYKSALIACRNQRYVSLQIPNADEAYIRNPGSAPLLETTIGKLLEAAAERYPHRHSVVSLHQNRRLTFPQLLERADRVAAGLRRKGLRRGDRIGLWGPNDYQWLLVYMGASRAGLVVAGLNPMYQAAELHYCLRKIGVRAVVAPRSFRTQQYARMLLDAKETAPALEHVILYDDEHVAGTRRLTDVENLASRIEVEAVRHKQDEISPMDGTNIQFTSGTTGFPKAAYLAHRSFINNAALATKRLRLDEDKVCMNMPFFHVFGAVMGVVAPLTSGSTIVLDNPTFNPVNSVEAITGEKCSVVLGTPTMWINMIDVQTRMRIKIDSVSAGVIGGAPISPELVNRIHKHFRFQGLSITYGMTETSGVVNQSLPDEPTELKNTTVGFIGDHQELKVTDDQNNIVPFGTPGELQVRGYNVMIGYWNDEEATKKTITEDGWLKTGDQYVLRKDGYGQIVGRLKDMIIRGGENIFPKEIECFLEGHPAIIEAHAFGVHDDVYGEEICACIRLSEGAKLTNDELRNYCHGKIAKFKIPKYILFRDEFPNTPSGKVQKFKLKEEVEREGMVPKKV